MIMKLKRKLLCIVFLFSIYVGSLQGQETIAASGGNYTGSGGSISYTAGQIAISTLSGINGTVIQGVQQPYEISVVTAIRNAEDINLKCLVYPNPAVGMTKLVFDSPDFENMKYQLFDLNGLLLQEKKVENSETEIYLENLSSSVYFLKVIKNNFEVKVFKIVKR
jgi:hypothetical protein